MWVITVFEQNSYRIFNYDNKSEALLALESIKEPAILSLTM